MNCSGDPFRAAVVILAAGRSRRMGTNKLLLPWNDGTVLSHLLQQWRLPQVQQRAVVCSPEATGTLTELDRLGFPESHRILNPDPDRGMFSSIQCAVRWTGWVKGLSHWIITLGDQPHLRQSTLLDLLQFAAAHPESICQPRWAGRWRHPVVFPAEAFRALGASTAPDLKQHLESVCGERTGFESDDSGLDADMDTPEDYQRLGGKSDGEGSAR